MATNPIDSGPNDPAVSRLLHEWKVTTLLPRGFRSQVWKRIDQSRANDVTGAGTAWLNWLQNAFVRPAVALAYLMILLIAGSLFGWSHGQKENGRLDTVMGARYVRAIDPYQRLR